MLLLHSGCLIWRVLISFIYHHCRQHELDVKAPYSFLLLPSSETWLIHCWPGSQADPRTPPCNPEQRSCPFKGAVTRLHYQQPQTKSLFVFSATGFKLRRSKGTFLKKCSIFFNLFKLLTYSNLLFTNRKSHQHWTKYSDLWQVGWGRFRLPGGRLKCTWGTLITDLPLPTSQAKKQQMRMLGGQEDLLQST